MKTRLSILLFGASMLAPSLQAASPVEAAVDNINIQARAHGAMGNVSAFEENDSCRRVVITLPGSVAADRLMKISRDEAKAALLGELASGMKEEETKRLVSLLIDEKVGFALRFQDPQGNPTDIELSPEELSLIPGARPAK